MPVAKYIYKICGSYKKREMMSALKEKELQLNITMVYGKLEKFGGKHQNQYSV